MERTTAVVVAVGLLLAGCGSTSGVYRGTVVQEFPPVGTEGAGPDQATPRWFVTLDLDGRSVAGTDIVTVAFNPEDASCRSGEAVVLDMFTPDLEVEFDRVGDDADSMSPPVISAVEIVADC